MLRLPPFQDDLPIPDVVHPSVDASGRHQLAVAARPARVHLHASLPATSVWSYRLTQGTVARRGRGTSYLGPTIEVDRDEAVTVAWHNAMPAAATLPYEVVKVPYREGDAAIPQNAPGRDDALPDAEDHVRMHARGLHAALVTHLHGGRTQSDSDGWPDNTTVPGQVAHATYGNAQAATMLWYHDHAMHVTRLNVYAGLAGAWFVRDDAERRLRLPHGEYEIPLILQDRNLDVDDAGHFTGALLHKTETGDGPAEFFGPYTLVNGTIWPKLDVAPRPYRFRVLNGANARTFRLLLLDAAGDPITTAIWQIGCDQGLMEHPTALPATGLLLAPAERVDLLVDFAAHAGGRVYLWNTADAPFGDDPANAPDTAQVRRELAALLADPLASAGAMDLRSAVTRRPFPQVMRFDVAPMPLGHGPDHAPGNDRGNALDNAVGTPSDDPSGRSTGHLPPDPLRPARPTSVLDTATPVRVMLLVERGPADPPPGEAPAVDATSMLTFWECLRVSEAPPPPLADVFVLRYWHPGQGAYVTEAFWRAAENFYDATTWRVHLDATEVWYVVNLSPDTHPIHVHLVDMTVTQRYAFTWNGVPDVDAPPREFDPNNERLTWIAAADASTPIEPNVRGPKDTVRVNPGEMVGLTMTFSPFPGRYMYHCHILEHEDHDMMRPFVVVPRWVPHHDD